MFSDGGKPIRSESPTTLFRKSRSLSTPFDSAHGSVSQCTFYKIPNSSLFPKYHASLPSLNTFIMNMFECGNVCLSYSWVSWPQYSLWQNKHYKREYPFKSYCHSQGTLASFYHKFKEEAINCFILYICSYSVHCMRVFIFPPVWSLFGRSRWLCNILLQLCFTTQTLGVTPATFTTVKLMPFFKLPRRTCSKLYSFRSGHIHYIVLLKWEV